MVLGSYAMCPRRPVVMGAGTQSPLYSQQLDLATPQEWQQLVPRDILQDVAAQHGGDGGEGKLTAPVHLVGVLSKGCSSLKDLISRAQQRFGRALGWLKGDKPWVTPSALSQRNKGRPVAFWQGLYQRLRQHHFGTGWLRKAWQRKVGVIQAGHSRPLPLGARPAAAL